MRYPETSRFCTFDPKSGGLEQPLIILIFLLPRLRLISSDKMKVLAVAIQQLWACE